MNKSTDNPLSEKSYSFALKINKKYLIIVK